MAALLAVYTTLARFDFPVGEKFIRPMRPGAGDLVMPFNGARALVLGVDPYHNDLRALDDPYRRDVEKQVVGGRVYRVAYLAPHLLLDVPLVLASGGQLEPAARLWFALNLAFLAALVAVAWRLARRFTAGSAAEIVPLLGVALSVNVATSLGLDRGQSDLLTSLLSWGGVALALSGWPAVALALVASATVLKGYAALLLVVLLGASPTRRALLRGLAGAGVAAVAWLAPVASHVADGLVAARARASEFEPIWYNHSFKNLAFELAPTLAEPGRIALTLLAITSTALCAWQSRRARAARTLWLTLASTCALAAVIGWSGSSYEYNLVLVLPGALAASLGHAALSRALGLDAPSHRALGTALVFMTFLLFVGRFGSMYASPSAYGLAVLVAICGTCALAALRRPADA